MKYVFDTGVFIDIFRHYYRDQFPSFWEQFDRAVGDGKIVSTREVFKELEQVADDALAWAKQHRAEVFPEPRAEEMEFVARIFSEQPDFRQLVRKKKRLEGGPCADPFVIAMAKIESRAVVTTEKHRPESARIPNICDAHEIVCVNLEKFMREEGWKF